MDQKQAAAAKSRSWAILFFFLLCGVSMALSASAWAETPSPVQPVRSFEVAAFEAAHSLSTPEAENALALQHRGSGIVEQLDDIEGNSYAGVWFDAETSKFVVPIVDPTATGSVRRLLAANKLDND